MGIQIRSCHGRRHVGGIGHGRHLISKVGAGNHRSSDHHTRNSHVNADSIHGKSHRCNASERSSREHRGYRAQQKRQRHNCRGRDEPQSVINQAGKGSADHPDADHDSDKNEDDQRDSAVRQVFHGLLLDFLPVRPKQQRHRDSHGGPCEHGHLCSEVQPEADDDGCDDHRKGQDSHRGRRPFMGFFSVRFCFFHNVFLLI